MTRKEFNNLPSNIYMPMIWKLDKPEEMVKFLEQPACPDCGERTTHPTPGCYCRDYQESTSAPHIMKFHHTCNK